MGNRIFKFTILFLKIKGLESNFRICCNRFHWDRKDLRKQ